MKKLILITVASVFIGCTENSVAKNFGGKSVIAVPCGQKVNNITWKETNLWYSTTEMSRSYKPQTHTFQENSNFGMLQGQIVLVEHRCED